ncbi:class I SAM-dependent DNA methyltransferase [Aurantiacibacter sp. MUD61]|uniref:class I SAM-dependent DNA methyltransferase n=1 Tax=Aurantiacibacter sp. MUD61 TaxID=3009083 RepID=UPI0022F0E7F9|nr:DNA methyltransferase [Aurantiacibacter sp. MUD61]
MGEVDQTKLEKLIADFGESGGGEMANAQLFVERLTGALGVEQPSPAKEETRLNDYVFERGVTFRHPGGSTSTGRIDCYKRDCFIWEAKQSAKREKARATEQLEMAGIEAPQKLGHAKRGTKTWDKVMIAAKKQAEDYARALPDDHAYPPFLLVADIGNVIEVYADFSGQGRNYSQFPDKLNYRLSMDDLRDEEVQDRLRAIWTDPNSLDPTRISAAVTEDIAERLAKIAKSLEKRHDPKDIAEFLMRCLFTMFAEDVELIPDHGFQKLLQQMVETPENFPPALESLWQVMDKGGYAPHLNATLKRFNGSLFKTHRALPLEADDIRELWLASKKDWRDVEPAIFGTLLERALNTKERGKLGAHFTPRVYVERLVVPTIIEPLREDWEEVQALVEDLRRAGKPNAAIEAVRAFHHQLCTTRVLDPACGTGNFLYVSLELMKRLEGEILETLEALGDDEARLLFEGETVNPRQFYGLEINPRAVPIADLVLWIGFLKWQLRTVEVKDLPEPILHAYGTIKEQDAILAYDKQELLRNEDGTPMTRWDGETMKLHPITGEKIPDPDAQVELYSYENPRRADWPEVEFIVGNPPFIGGKDMRAELGDGYAEAAWKARKGVPGGADFVMHFWDEAATRLLAKPPAKVKGENPLRRFGFITTNSITQTFSRRVVEKHMNAKLPLSLVYAVPDHPWMQGVDKAAVRIALTVAVRGERQGKLAEVVHESALNTDTPDVRLESDEGKITSKLKLGADLSKLAILYANDGISSRGVSLHGSGFIVSPQQASGLGREQNAALRKHIREYFNGKDLTARPRGVYAIDLFGLSAKQVQEKYPNLFQYITDNVRAEREGKVGKSPDLAAYAKEWWLFGKTRPELRSALLNLSRYVSTVETSKHRFFQFLDVEILPDNMLVNFAFSDAEKLALMTSRLHTHWALELGGTLGPTPRYNKTKCYNPFPFATLGDTQSAKLDELGSRLDAFRKERLAEHDFLTMTDMYNVLERLRELDAGAEVAPLSDKEKDIHEAGLISVLKDIHDEIDREVFAAYGWEDLGKRLVGKPGATTPSPHKSEDQEEAEEELLTRLVALNQERAAEEKRGLVRWLRPDFQIPRLGHKVSGSEQVEADLGEAVLIEERKWPSDGLEQIRTVRDVLAEAEAPLPAEALATLFKGRTTAKRKARVSEVLETLVATGAARDGDGGYFLPR